MTPKIFPTLNEASARPHPHQEALDILGQKKSTPLSQATDALLLDNQPMPRSTLPLHPSPSPQPSKAGISTRLPKPLLPQSEEILNIFCKAPWKQTDTLPPRHHHTDIAYQLALEDQDPVKGFLAQYINQHQPGVLPDRATLVCMHAHLVAQVSVFSKIWSETLVCISKEGVTFYLTREVECNPVKVPIWKSPYGMLKGNLSTKYNEYVTPDIRTLGSLCDPNALHTSSHPSDFKLHPEFWDTDWQRKGEGESFYRDSRPRTAAMVHEIFLLGNLPKDALIIDMGCGKGELLHLMMNGYFPAHMMPELQFFGFDFSRSSIAEARTKAPQDTRGKFCHGSIDDVEKLLAAIYPDGKRPHVITVSGIFTTGVTTQQQSIHALQSCHRILAPGGFIIITGLEASHLNVDDFKMTGFEVLHEFSPVTRSYFYVLRKSLHADASPA